MYQKIIVAGRISAPETSQSGKMIRFGVACQERREGPVEWFNGRVLNPKMVEALGPLLSKGRMVLIEGRQETSQADDGRRFTNLIVDRLRLLGPSEESNQSAAAPQQAASQGNPASEVYDDDIPF